MEHPQPTGRAIHGMVIGLTLTGAFWIAIFVAAFLFLDRAGIAPI